jgi:putative lipoic acid-binding regulatory protein|tara:strand:- start:638 stop:775 length:138 start_codon:yes stop_codon:yes gene_type:complete
MLLDAKKYQIDLLIKTTEIDQIWAMYKDLGDRESVEYIENKYKIN